MKNIIIIREYKKETDHFACQELLRASIMSHVSSAFFMFLFKEITLQLMVLIAAIFFIFLGLPILLCISTIPTVAILVYVIAYGNHSFKSSEVSQTEPMKRWVAEAYEPYLMATHPKNVKYGVFNENEYKSEEIDTSSLCKKIVGVVNVRDYFGPDNSLWLYGLAVDPKYHRKGIASLLVRNAIHYTRKQGYGSLELVTTDLQSEARQVFQDEGFQLKQIYHRQILGLVPIGKYQMGILFNSN